MSNKKYLNPGLIVLIVLIFIAILLYFKGYDNSGTNTGQVPNNQAGQEDEYSVFTSQDGRLTFDYKRGWKCEEKVIGVRVDCYPDSRVEEEYEAGLDLPSVYYPDISIMSGNNDFCDLSVDEKIVQDTNESPIKYNEAGEIYYGKYYKKYNGCLVEVITLPEIDSVSKLNAILR